MLVTRTGKILQEIVDRLGHRKDVYTAAKFSESYLSKLIRQPKPLGVVVLSRVCRAFPERSRELLDGWLHDRADSDYAAACDVRNDLGYALKLRSLAATKELDTRLVMELRHRSEAAQRGIAKLLVATGGDEQLLLRRLELAQSKAADEPKPAATQPRGSNPDSEGSHRTDPEGKPRP